MTEHGDHSQDRVLNKAVEDPMEFQPEVDVVSADAVTGMVLAMVIWVIAFMCAQAAMARSVGEALGTGGSVFGRRK